MKRLDIFFEYFKNFVDVKMYATTLGLSSNNESENNTTKIKTIKKPKHPIP